MDPFRVLPPAPAPAVRGAPVAGGDVAGALLDGLSIGLVLLDEDARPGFTDAEARRQLAAGTSGLVVSGGVLRPADARFDPAWRGALRAAAIGRPCGVRTTDRPDAAEVALSPGVTQGTVLCVLPIDETRRAAQFARRHGLTASESDVLAGLLRGESPKAVARRRGVAELTVRSQIKSLLAKSGRHTIRDLVAAALRLPTLVGCPREARTAPLRHHPERAETPR